MPDSFTWDDAQTANKNNTPSTTETPPGAISWEDAQVKPSDSKEYHAPGLLGGPTHGGFQTVNDLVANAGTGLVKGASAIAGLPRTLADLGQSISPTKEGETSLDPMSEFSEGLGNFIRSKWPTAEDIHSHINKTLNLEDYKPSTELGKVGQAAAENVPAALATGGGAPVAALAAAGGATGEKAAELFPDHPVLARFAGNVLGSVGAGLLKEGASATYGLAKSAVNPLTKSGQEGIVANALEKASGGEVPTIPENTELVPGSPTTTAQATGSPQLLATEKSLAQTSPEADKALRVIQYEQNEARINALRGLAPGPAGADTTAEYLANRAKNFEDEAQSIIDQHRQVASDRLQALGPGSDAQSTGSIIRDEFNNAQLSLKGRINNAYESVDPEGTLSMDVKPVYTKAAQSVAKYFGPGSGGPPPVITSIMKDLEAENVPYQTLQNIYSRATGVASQAGASGDPQLRSAAGSIAQAVRDHIEDMAENTAGAAKTLGVTENVGINGEMTPQQAQALIDARALRRQQGSQFEQGASARVGAVKAYGEPTLSPAEVPSAYFNSTRGAPDDAAKFIETLGDRPKAVQALQDYAVRDLRDYASSPDGSLNPNKFNTWMKAHDGALSQFPELKGQLSSVAEAQSTVDDLTGRLKQGLDEVNKSATRFFLKRDPDQAVDGVLRSKTAKADMQQLVDSVKTDPSGEALMGLRKAIVDHAIDNGSIGPNKSPILQARQFTNWMNDNADTVAPAFEKSHMDMLNNIQADLERSNRVNAPVYGKGSQTYQNLTMGQLIDNVLGGSNSPIGRLVSTKVPGLTETLARPLEWLYKAPEEDMQQMFQRAIIDPEYARTLTLKITPQNVKGISSRLADQMKALQADLPESVKQNEQQSRNAQSK